jgi:hypothetical protein
MAVLPTSTLKQQINFHEEFHTDCISGMHSTHLYFLRDFGFRREVGEMYAPPGYYAAYSGNSLPTFRENLSVPSWRVKKSKHRTKNRIYWTLKMKERGCAEKSVRMYHYMMRNIPEQCRYLAHFLPTATDNNSMWQRRTCEVAVVTDPLTQLPESIKYNEIIL